MNTSGKQNSIILIAVIMAVIVTAVFLVVEVTAVFVTAYIFALIGIAAFCGGNLYMLSSPNSYPWVAAFPMRIWSYLIVELILSAVFVLAENLFAWSIPIQWFILLHIILLAICLITLIMIKGGKEIIDRRGEEVKQKVTALRFMQADIESMIQKFPNHEKDLRQVADALRYSDPMSHPSLSVYEEQIQRGIISIGDGANIPDKCAELLRQIADRNARVKMMK